jgi:hypothetical protein
MKWVSLIRNLLALLVGILIGFAIFGGLQYYFRPNFWMSVAIAVLGALSSAIGLMLDFVKKGYEIRKLRLEVRKLAREEQAAGSLVRLSTDEELRMYAGPVRIKNIHLEKQRLVPEDSVTNAEVREEPEVREVRWLHRIIGKVFD